MKLETRNRIFEAALLAASVCLSLALMEAILRTLSPSPYAEARFLAPQETFFQYDPLLGWRGIPRATGRFRGRDFDVQVKLDENGYRNAGPLLAPGKRNVLVLGDSYGWGWGVDDDAMFHHRIMKKDPRWNVYNLSAPGYGTDQQYLTLRETLERDDGPAHEGSFLLFYFNDFADNSATARYGYPKPVFTRSADGELSLGNVPVPRWRPKRAATRSHGPARRRAWWNRSHAVNFLWFKLRALWRDPTSRRPETSRSSGAGPTEQDREALEVTLALLRATAELSRSNDMFFHVVILMTHKVDPDAWQWQPMEELLVRHGIEHSTFRSTRIPNTDLWLDGHLSPYGHDKLARHLRAALSRH